MELQELIDYIRLPKEAAEQIQRKRMTEEEYQGWKALLYCDAEMFIGKWRQKEDALPWALEFFLRIAAEVHGDYKKAGISDTVYIQTFYDITLWCRDCHTKYGVYGLEEAPWFVRLVKMEIFRLGRLEFERVRQAGKERIHVHIPADGPLDFQACLGSFAEAEDFFGDAQGERRYVCESWLLSPHLRELLPEECNILRFQRLFSVLRTVYGSTQAEERIFDRVLADKESYPENTSLRKAAKSFLLSGRRIGMGYGYIEDMESVLTRRKKNDN